MTLKPSGTHRESHRTLLRQERCGDGSVDAIVMPASRPAANLLPAMEVAAALGRHFVGLCSGRTGVEEAAGLAEEVPDLAWTLVELPADWSTGLLDFSTSEIPAATRTRLGDLSAKRNIGLLLARLVGWHGVLFLDDDIRDVSPRTIRAAGYALRPGRATGMIATDFPDNSVVCHAARLAGLRQDVFVSGSALAVDTRQIGSFFPDVYNEDWLFFYDLVRLRRVSAAGVVRQAPYRPFAKPERAANQEFGDLLAEGLMSLQHDRADLSCAMRTDFWRSAIDERHSLLATVTASLVGEPGGGPALAAVDAARAVLESLDADVLCDYVERWRQDIGQWQNRLDRLPRLGSVPAALDFLDLPYLAHLELPCLAREERVLEPLPA